jgi:U32 family peptidase
MANIPELVLPAGTLEKLQVACLYGADAVYAGMPQFSLRARTNSFTEAQLAEGIAYAHARGVNVYVTLNIFAHNARLSASLEALRTVAKLGADAIILSDPGLIMFARQECPEVELHLSTQANTMNWAAVQFWQTQGIKRVILPRELAIAEIAEIHARVPEMALEVFVHGAMCISYSGRCLLSSYLTHRAANLGACTNSCRWQYRLLAQSSTDEFPSLEGAEVGNFALEETKRPGEFFPIEEDAHGTYILNSRDLCAIEYLQRLRDAGVTGFKAEGRTKSIYYLSQIGRAYRRALNDLYAGRAFNPDGWTDIYATASRGYIPGFLVNLPEETRQNYDRGSPVYSTYEFGGVVRGYDADRQWANVEVRNRIEIGDVGEFVTPQTNLLQPIEAMYDQQQQSLRVAHGGSGNIWLATPYAVTPLTILRIRRKTNGTENGAN